MEQRKSTPDVQAIARKYDVSTYFGESDEEVIDRLGYESAKLIQVIGEMSGCTLLEAAEAVLAQLGGRFTVSEEK